MPLFTVAGRWAAYVPVTRCAHSSHCTGWDRGEESMECLHKCQKTCMLLICIRMTLVNTCIVGAR